MLHLINHNTLIEVDKKKKWNTKLQKMYKELKSERDDFKKRYGDRADEVMHATAMTMAKRKYGYTYILWEKIFRGGLEYHIY